MLATMRVGAVGAAVALIAVLAASTPAAAGPPDRDEVTTVAHRGASDDAPENTLAAVEEGIAQGADLVEIDLQRSSDGKLVVIHDTYLARTTNAEEVFPDRAPWNVGDFTFQELRTLDAGSWKGDQFAGEQIPTLEEVLDTLAGSGTGLLLEVKSPELYPGLAQDVATALQERPRWWRSAPLAQRLIVQSFNWDFMAEFDELAPHLTLGLLGRAEASELPDLAWADQINPSHTEINEDWVDAVHEHGFEVYVYTVNEPDDMRRAERIGVDGIISDRPALLRDVLDESGVNTHPGPPEGAT